MVTGDTTGGPHFCQRKSRKTEGLRVFGKPLFRHATQKREKWPHREIGFQDLSEKSDWEA